MAPWQQHRISAAQAARLDRYLPRAEIVRDHSWGLLDTVVLEVVAEGERYLVKAAGPENHHLAREIAAYETVVPALARPGFAPTLVFADRRTNLLVTEFLDGELLLGTSAAHEPDAYRQAGRLLRMFHDQITRLSPDFEARANARAIAWLDSPNRIGAAYERHARSILSAAAASAVTVVPTHGDYQPRNWLIDAGGTVKTIDFGRFDFRPAATDFTRMAGQEWPDRPDLEAAFFEGYGHDPREPESWRLMLLREAIGTAAWAFQVGDVAFEEHGHQLLARALAGYAEHP